MIAEKQQKFYNDFVILPPELIAIVDQPQRGHWKGKCSLLENFIRDVLPNELSLGSELDLLETHWEFLSDYVPNFLKSINFLGFRNISFTLRINFSSLVASC